jgi:hypothetical protein
MVRRAVALGLPCLVLVREPEETVLSLAVRLPYLSVRQALRGYVRFYEPVLRLRQRFVIGPFQDVTTDLGAVIDRLNERYGTSFDRFEHTPENERATLEEVDRWDRGAFGGDAEALVRSRATPTEGRVDSKDERRAEYVDDRLWSLRTRAERAYAAFMETARG